MRIMAVDPGRTTGYCIIEALPSGGPIQVIDVGEILWDSRFRDLWALINFMFDFAAKPKLPVAFVVEAFRLRQGRAYEQSGSDFPSSQVCAIFQSFLWMRDPNFNSYTPILQEPSCMARVQVLPEHKELIEGSEHKKDAYKHARYYYVTQVYNGTGPS